MSLAKDESGMTLLAVMAVMAIFAIGLMAVAPSIQMGIQREKELESIHRGEEVADAIRQYVEFYRGARLPNSIDDLLDGLPQGTKKRAILRASAAIDPLSEDGRWRLIKPEIDSMGSFVRRVQQYNGGILPSNPSGIFDRYTARLQGALSVDDLADDDPEDSVELLTDNTPFIGVASQSQSRSILTYYGAENHSQWVYTPLFRGPTNVFRGGRAPPRPFGTPTPRR